MGTARRGDRERPAEGFQNHWLPNRGEGDDAAAVDDEDGAVAGGAQQVAEQAVALVAGDRTDRSREAAVAAELTELQVADAEFGAVPVDEVGGGQPVKGVGPKRPHATKAAGAR